MTTTKKRINRNNKTKGNNSKRNKTKRNKTKRNKTKRNNSNNKKCIKTYPGPNPPFHEAVIYELFVKHTDKKIKEKDYDVMMKSLQKYKPNASCVKFQADLIGKSKDVDIPFSMSLKDARKLVKNSK